MNSVSVQQLRLRILTFLIVVLFLSSFQAFLWLNGSRSESVFSWLSFDASMAIFQNDSARTALFDRLKASGNIVKTKRLGVASSITILSLPTRLDRRQDMDSLRLLLDIPKSEWKYMDAVASTDKRVLPVLEWVQYVRSTFVASAPKSRFSWPDEEEIDRLVQSDTVLGLWDTYPWLSPVEIESRSAGSGFPNANPPSVPCMIKDFTLPRILDQSAHIPPHRILTPARVACWYSHLEAIQRIANSPVLQEQEAAIILEDDVDMESDIVEQLGLLWKSLPLHWDIVFLGTATFPEPVTLYSDFARSLLVKRVILYPSLAKPPISFPQPLSLPPPALHARLCPIPTRRATNYDAPSPRTLRVLPRN